MILHGIEAKGRFGKQDFVYLSDEDVYRCPAGEKLAYHYTNEENGLVYAAIGPTPVRAAPSNSVAPLARSDGLRAGSMSMCWRRYRNASTETRRPCASVARLPNIPSAR